MSTVLAIYSTNAFKRYLLPAVNNANHSIFLSGDTFGFEGSIELKLEVIEYMWYFVPADEYELGRQDGSSCFSSALQDGDIIKLTFCGRVLLSVIVRQMENYFSVYQKYGLDSNRAHVTIGHLDTNDIVYNQFQLLSGKHAQIQVHKNGAFFEDLGSVNGSFVNNRRVEGSIPLFYGDRIDIYGLRIVYLGTFLAINVSESGAAVSEKNLKSIEISADRLSDSCGRKIKNTFHRSPRHIAKIRTAPVSIEEAPQPKTLDQPSMFMTIVPSLTMALPMILGCVLMVWASSLEKTGYSNIYQYIGLITAVLSTLIGIIWAVQAQKSAKKRFEIDKAFRNQKYREYLNKKEELIKETYAHNTSAMLDRYQSADECCNYNVENSVLWNRNGSQPDFLSHRVGIGDVPFQAEIVIPVERFSLLEDELTELPAKIKSHYAMLHNAPVCIDFMKEKLVGVVGGKNLQGAVNIAQAVIAQIAANHSYTDVKLVIIYDEKKNELNSSWKFARWLPHVWNETGTFRYVASNKEEASEVFYELIKVFRSRVENAMHNQSKDNKPYIAKPYYMIVLANPDVLEGELISKYIFDPDPVYGVSTLYLAGSYEDLPNECEFVLENDGQFHGMYHVTDDLDDRTEIEFDPISSNLLEHLATNLSNIEINEIQTGGDVPGSLTFFDMYGISKLSELNVLNRWRKNRAYESMKAMVGQKAGGTACYLDVHEKYHGPHGLVAGTTGSGKSETLQTYILSLCINFSPKDVALFVIDYKGGGMGNLFTDLPHLIGQISNLSGNQIRRALVSVKSEKDRRQRIFNEHGVNSINSYTKLYKNNEARIPVPHLFIIIDEFAEMKRDEPDFIQELVSVSQVGRSLGIHLIMATQKPAGTVDDNIWSNSRFKLCLRVQDRQDSMDMLHKPDAAYIIQAGRCYLQVGNDELFELFQSGWSGAPFSEDEADAKTDIAKMLAIDGVPALEGSRAKIIRKYEKKRLWIHTLLCTLENVLAKRGVSLENACETLENRGSLIDTFFKELKEQEIEFPFSEANEKALNALLDLCASEGMDAETVISAAERLNKKLPEPTEKTQLDAVVGYLASVAAANDYIYDFSLFLPLLSEKILLKDLPQTMLPFNEMTAFNGKAWPGHTGDWSLAVSMGLFDDPENQRQDTFVLDLASAGNVAVVGAMATGKSVFLQTFVYGLVMRYSPAEVNIYAIDFSAKMLAAFENAPHMGGFMNEEDTEKISKFLAFLGRMLEARKKLLKGGSFEQYIALHGQGSIPAVVIVIDNYSGFQAKADLTEQNEEFMVRLSKEGVSYGIFLVTTSAGFGHEELPNRMADNFRTTVCLELNDFMGYSEILRRNVQVFPETDIKGRGIAVIEDRILEFQTVLSMDADSDYGRGEKIKKQMVQMSAAWEGKRAKPIPEIPKKPVWDEFARLDDVQEMLRSERYLPLGYESEHADIFGIDLSKIYTYIISGNKRKGKTNVLKCLILSAAAKGGRVIVIDYASSLGKICGEVNAEHITTEEQFYQFLTEFLPEFEARNVRKHELLDEGLEEDEIFVRIQQFEKTCFFIDDFPGFVEKTYETKEDPERVGEYYELLEQILDFGTLHNIYWFVCVNKKDTARVDIYTLHDLFLRDKKGIHLGGITDDSMMNFDHLPYGLRDQVMPAGKGLLPVDNEDNVDEIIIPLVKSSAGAMQAES